MDLIRTAGPKAITTGSNSPAGGIPDPLTTPSIDDKAAELPHLCQGSPQSLRNIPLFDVKDEPSPVRVEWSEMDFPPLSDVRGERRTEYGVWGEKRASDLDADGYVASMKVFEQTINSISTGPHLCHSLTSRYLVLS